MDVVLITGLPCRAPEPGINTQAVVIATSGTPYGSVYEYQCLRGFTTPNKTRAYCMINGEWSIPPPKCGKVI